MSEGDVPEGWELTDRVADQVTELINSEISSSDFCPTKLLAGLCLGLLSFMDTAPLEDQPPLFRALRKTLVQCIAKIGLDIEGGEVTVKDSERTLQ